MRKIIKKIFKKSTICYLLLAIFSLTFSLWLMFHTFYYKDGSMLIATKVWSDFASHIPLIRSFSFGENFPPQYPLFSGPPIRYHFIFYSLVGLLEKLGLRIDFALNIPSALGFTSLLIMIFLFTKMVFKKFEVALLSCIFFLFNGTFSFLYFFKLHPLSLNTPHQIINNASFPSFDPYGPGIVSAFWNLNIYTNQRHLAASFAICLFIIFCSLLPVFTHHSFKKTIYIFLGTLLGLMFFFHTQVFFMTEVILGFIFLLFPKTRFSTFLVGSISALLAIPQFFFLEKGFPFKMNLSDLSSLSIIFKPGYLISDNLTPINFLNYWMFNLGFHLYLIILGFIWAPKNIKKLFLVFLSLFILGNLFQFSPEMAANHKFFNLFMIFGVMLSSSALVTIWNYKTFTKPIVVVLFFLLVLSGIIDFFPVLNDTYVSIDDYPKNPDIQWIIKNTPPNSIFFNTNYLYDSANLAGRKIYYGWPYFSWSQGLDTYTRQDKLKAFLSLNNPLLICQFLKTNNLNYISLTSPSSDFPYDPNFWVSHFQPIYQSSSSNLKIYSIQNICSS